MASTGSGTKNSTINKAEGPAFIGLLVWQETKIIIKKCTIKYLKTVVVIGM